MYIPAQTRIDGHHYWQARSLDGHQLRYDSPFGPRRDALVVMRSLTRGEGRGKLVIVEGPMDALAVSECVGCVGVALMGISPSEEALTHLSNIIHTMRGYKLRCVADRDSVGEMAKVQGWLARRGYGSHLVVPQGFKDVCEGTVEQREELLKI